MTSRDFCYWLQGYFELESPKTLSKSRVDMVKRHLALVFEHEIDPSIDKGDRRKSNLLNLIHGKSKPNKPRASSTVQPKYLREPLIRC